MLGAIIGDIVGSTREWHNIKTEDFELVPKGSLKMRRSCRSPPSTRFASRK